MLRDAEVLEGLLQGTSLVDCGSQRAFSYWFFLKNRFLVKNFTDTRMLESYNHGHILELCSILENLRFTISDAVVDIYCKSQ